MLSFHTDIPGPQQQCAQGVSNNTCGGQSNRVIVKLFLLLVPGTVPLGCFDAARACEQHKAKCRPNHPGVEVVQAKHSICIILYVGAFQSAFKKK